MCARPFIASFPDIKADFFHSIEMNKMNQIKTREEEDHHHHHLGHDSLERIRKKSVDDGEIDTSPDVGGV